MGCCMSKRLIPWYAGVLAAEMISAAIGIVAFSYTSIFDFESRIYHMGTSAVIGFIRFRWRQHKKPQSAHNIPERKMILCS